jgi:hypothetical protein
VTFISVVFASNPALISASICSRSDLMPSLI